MKTSLFILVAFLGYGCAAKKLAIDHADTLLSRQIEKRLPLYSEQRQELERDIDHFLIKMKPTAKAVIPIIDQITLEEPPQGKSQLEVQYHQLEAFVKEVSEKFSDLFSKYMAKLDYKQQKDFFATMEKENKEILKKDRLDRLEDIEDHLKMFLGKVNGEQEKIIASYGDYFVENAKKRVERRKALHERFKYIFAQDISPSTRQELFQEAFVEYQEESMKRSKGLEILKKIVPTLTDAQKTFFKAKTQEIKGLLKYFLQVDY